MYVKVLEQGPTDSNPICECMMMVAQRMASMVGLRVPAAKGAIVSGKMATEMILFIARSVREVWIFGQDQSVPPFERPMVAAVSWLRLGDWGRVVGCSRVRLCPLSEEL